MSITKQFTAAAILKLEMMGKLRVTDPIGRHLGQVPADKRPITLHQLLTHTAGLAEGLGDDYDVLARDDFLTRALASKPLSAPGTTFHYSNMGYGLLAAIVEKVSGLGYENFLAEHLFAPAGMTRTGYVLPTWEPGRIAVEYDDEGAAHGRPIAHPWAQDGPYWNLHGNGGMLSTARDLLRWHRALSGTGVLSATAKRKMFSPQVRMPDSQDSYGYGWVISDTDSRPDRLARRRQLLVAGEPRAVPGRRRHGLLGQQPRLPARAVEPGGPHGTADVGRRLPRADRGGTHERWRRPLSPTLRIR